LEKNHETEGGVVFNFNQQELHWLVLVFFVFYVRFI